MSPPEEDRECDHSSEANEHPEEVGRFQCLLHPRTSLFHAPVPLVVVFLFRCLPVIDIVVDKPFEQCLWSYDIL